MSMALRYWANAKSIEELFPEAAKWHRERKDALDSGLIEQVDHHPGPGDHQLVQGPDRRGRGNRRHKVDDPGRVDVAGTRRAGRESLKGNWTTWHDIRRNFTSRVAGEE